MVRAKVLRRKHSKAMKVRLIGYFLSRFKLDKDPVILICFGKAIYRLDMDRGNQDFFVVALKRAILNGSTKSRFRIFLNFSYEEKLIVSFIIFF